MEIFQQSQAQLYSSSLKRDFSATLSPIERERSGLLPSSSPSTPLHGTFLTDVEEELLKLGADECAQ